MDGIAGYSCLCTLPYTGELDIRLSEYCTHHRAFISYCSFRLPGGTVIEVDGLQMCAVLTSVHAIFKKKTAFS